MRTATPGLRMTAAPVLDASGVAKSYGAVAALRNASLSVLPGEVHALMGANGAGKSTLVKILTGAVRPDRGRILLRGAGARHRLPRRRPPRRPRPGLPGALADPRPRRRRQPPAHRHAGRRRSATGSRELGLPDLDLRDLARDLPLATLRVLDLARALAVEPDVLLLDEMTAALPADLAERVLDVVRRQSAAGRSVIFISHRLLEIAALCDRATVLRDGETVGVVDIAPGAEERIVELMLGARIEKARAAPPRARDRRRDPARRASPSATSASAPSSRMSPSSSATARSSRVVALEGQGQDELFAALSGSVRPAAGSIEVDGRAGPLRPPRRRHRARASASSPATAPRAS